MPPDNQNNSPSKLQLLQKNIVASLSSAPGDSTIQCQHLQTYLEKNKTEACKIILHTLVQLNFSPNNACQHWEEIVKHAGKLQAKLGRQVGLTTAACDYFSTIQPCMDTPKLVEFARLEETMQSAHHDFLTGLLSRSTFQNFFAQEISRAKRHKHDATLIFFDLDHFKEINDEHGHLAGDEALKQVGKILLSSKRKEDIACRFGGDEFVILLPETNKYMGLLAGKKLHDKINNFTFRHNDKDIQITSSGGLATFPLDSDDRQGLIECADRALYHAKSSGKHKLVLFSEEKRTFTRIEFDRPLKIRSLGIQDHDRNSRSKNISEGGVLISCDKRYEIGIRLKLHISLEGGENLVFTGSVVRVEQIDTSLYDIGLSFLTLNSDSTSLSTSTEVIADYILQQLAR